MNNHPVANDEDFLGNCKTNAFFLADTRGLQWKKYCSSCLSSTNTTNDPILAAYSVALKSDVLSVWRRIPLPNAPNQELGARLFDCTKELYIFWFGEEPVLQDIPGPNLQEIEYGSFDNGINAVTLDLFFKAIHNIIERNLLNGDFVRLGKWFTKPVNEDINQNLPDSALGFNFSIFIHGENSVVATVDIQEKSCVRSLTEEDLLNCSKHSSGSGNDGKVLLAPYGLNGFLTGHHLSNTDAQSLKIIDEWKKFYPQNALKTKIDCPAVVEVMLGEIKMFYPASLVLMPVHSTPVKASTWLKNGMSANITNKSEDIVGYCWKCTKEREEIHSPTTQLWDFKPLTFQSGCSCCSSSNTTRVKSSSNNPFSTNAIQTKNASQNSNKLKKDTKANIQLFHQRIQKTEKVKTCSTPSLLTGRSSTPLVSSVSRVTCKTENDIIPQETFLKDVPEIRIDEPKNENILHTLPPEPVSTTTTTTEKITRQPLTYQIHDASNETVEKNIHTAKDFILPVLPENPLDPRFGEVLPEPEPPDEKPVVEEIIDLSCLPDPPKEMPKEEEYPAKKSVGRPRGKKRSPSLTGLSYIDGDISPGERRSKRLKESPLTSPAYSDTQSSSGPGRPQRRPSRISTRAKTPLTPKTEAQTFTFQSSRDSFSFPSPPPSHFSPTIKSSSLTTTKDLVPTCSDLEHLFDDDEEESGKKGLLSVSPADTVHISAPVMNMDSQLSTKITAMSPDSQPPSSKNTNISTSVHSLTQQDLAKMFPTPPSPPTIAMSPTTTIHHDIHVTGSVASHGACLEVLSPEMQHAITVSENDHIEINLETRSPATDGQSTFSLPAYQINPVPDIYKPLSLPSDHILLKIDLKLLKYTPTWDDKNKPPVLHRRPSNNRFQNASMSGNLDFQQKLDVISATTQFTSTPTQFTPIDLQNNGCASFLDQGLQSLIVTLTMTDSYIDWMNINQNALQNVFQEETFKLFSTYQNMIWRSAFIEANENSLFPEDNFLSLSKSNTPYPSSRSFESILNTTKNEVSRELLELLLKHFHSPYSVFQFLQIHNIYYKEDKNKFDHNNDDKVQLCKQNILFQLQQTIKYALQQCVRKNVWDSPKIEGPLSFQDIDSICNKNGVQSKSGISPLSVIYENDVISVAPSALRYWQTLLLEPFAGKKNVAYIVATPESEFIVHSTKQFFKEFNSIYESLNLGSHCPIVKDLRDGLLRINQKSVNKVANATVDDWFTQDPSKIMAKMKTIAQFCKHQLGPYVSSLGALDSSQLINRSSSTSDSSASSKQTPCTSTSSSNLLNATEDPHGELSENVSTTVFIYIVDPFHNMKIDSYPLLWSYLGMMRCFVEMCSSINGKLKENVQLQVIPLEQILQVNLKSRSKDTHGTENKELKSLAFSVYSQTRQHAIPQTNLSEKFMTSFGVGNLRKNVLRRRQVENTLPSSVFMPPFILSRPPTYLPNTHTSSLSKMKDCLSDDEANILFCSYTLSRDCNWLLVCCVDQYGELFESTLIKVLYPKRKKQKHLIWCVALRKLWEYLNGIISYTVSPWRVVLTKYGIMGQHELKELNSLMDKNIQNILPCHHVGRPISPLSETCISCSVDEKRQGKTLIKSISLCNLQTCNDFKFYTFNTRQNANSIYNRIYILPSPKNRPSNIRHTLKPTNHDLMTHDTLLATGFDDEHNFMPLSPSEHSIFQTSPQNDKILTSPPITVSPPSVVISNNNNISRLVSPASVVTNPNLSRLGSPFQPIATKHTIGLSVKDNVNTTSETSSCLCVGYLLSATSRHNNLDVGVTPQVFKSIFYNHVSGVDESTSNLNVPFDSSNNLEILRHILEKLDVLSWLNIDPSSGKRRSGLPVHIQTLIGFRDLLDNMLP